MFSSCGLVKPLPLHETPDSTLADVYFHVAGEQQGADELYVDPCELRKLFLDVKRCVEAFNLCMKPGLALGEGTEAGLNLLLRCADMR